MKRPTCHRPRLYLIAAACLGSGTLIQGAARRHRARHGYAGEREGRHQGWRRQPGRSELAGGPFQIRLPAGRFTAQCQPPSQKTVQIFSLAQPTTVNIDCS